MDEEKLSRKEKKNVLSVFRKKEIWISGIIGILLGIILVYLLGVLGISKVENVAIATMKTGKITESDLYKEMKKYYPVTYMLEIVDKQILDKKYELTQEQEEEINKQVELILEQYKNYEYTEEQFLEDNGFENKEDFVNCMKLDYRRNLCCIDYFKTIIPKEEIQNYYNDNDIYGKIYTKHILVQTLEDANDEKTLATANEIIAKLNSGTSFDDVVNEYSDKIASEKVDFDFFNEDALEKSYVEASKILEKDKYTTEPVKTNYGYHIIYCINKEDKPSFEKIENDIVEKLGEDLEAKDQYIRYKALIQLREDNKLKFKDSKFEEEYKEYCDKINSASK